MHKKAFAMEVFNVLIAAAVIATAFLIFYTYYGVSEKNIGGKITEKTSDFKENHALISLLNTPVGDRSTIADLIAAGKTAEAAQEIKLALQSVYSLEIKYALKIDGAAIAETSESPRLPVTQEVILPVPLKKPAKIILELGI